VTGTDIDYMSLALEEAEKAFSRGEVPVGAVLVTGDGDLYSDSNRTAELHLPHSHAESLVVQAACLSRGDWRLEDCTLYSTLEPCVMCAGIVLVSRIQRVVYGAWDKRFGAFGSVTDLQMMDELNHYPLVQGGVLADRSTSLLKAFFRRRRSLSQKGGPESV